MALIGSIPFADACCCLFYLGGGAFSLFIYNRSFMEAQEEIPLALPILLGIATGIIGALLSLITDWIVYLFFGYWEFDLAKKLIENMTEIPDYLEEMITEFERQKIHGFIWSGPLLSNLFTMPLFCIAGSLLARVFLNNQKNKIRKNLDQ